MTGVEVVNAENQRNQPVDPSDRSIPTEHVGTIPPNYYCRGWNPRRLKYCKARAGCYTDHPGEGRCKFHGGTNQTVAAGFINTPLGLRRRYQFSSPRLKDLLEKHEADENPLDTSTEIALLRTLSEDYLERYYPTLEALSAWHAQRRLDPDQMRAMYELIDEFEATRNGDMTEHQAEMLELARAAVQHLGEDIPRPPNIPDIADAARIVSETTKAVERVFNMRAKNAITYDQLRRFLFATERVIEARIRNTIPDPAEADKLIEKIGEEIRGIRP